MKAFVSLLVSLMLCLCASGAMAEEWPGIFEDRGFLYQHIDGETIIIDYTGDADELVIPVRMDGGYYVTEIAEGAFRNKTNLKSVKFFDEGVTRIGANAFNGCSNLVSVDLPAGLTELGGYAFANCTSLETVDIPSGVTEIGRNMFSDCDSLESIDLHDGITSIGEFAFSGCDSLASMDIPDAVTDIGYGAFEYCGSLKSISSKGNLKSIGEYAFYECGSLETVDLPAGLTSVGAHAFENCDGLYAIDLPDSVTSIGTNAFYSCNHLESVDLPDSLVLLDGLAFGSCGLKTVTLPEGLTRIGNSAFTYCGSLESVVLPDSLKEIGASVFSGCTRIQSMDLPDGLESIGNYAFSECDNLESIDLPDSVESIGWGAFSECAGLKAIIVPDGITSIAGNTFNECKSLKTIVLPDGLTTIEEYAFDGCESLETIELPDSLTGIGESAFSYCENLSFFDLPDGLKSIGAYAFNNCRSLVSIRLPDRLTSLGDRVFSSCESLAYVVLPDGLKNLGAGAFAYCYELSMICLPNGLETIGKNAFSGCALLSLTIPSSVTSIPEPVASYSYEMTSVVLPKELTEIAEDAFPSSVTVVYCYKDSAAETWAKNTGRIPVYLDNYNIAEDAQLIGPGSDGYISYLRSSGLIGAPYAWMEGVSVWPQPIDKPYTIQCEVANPEIAEVDGDVLNLLKPGKTTLTISVAELPHLSYARTLEVYYPIESFSFPKTVFVKMGGNYKLVSMTDVEPENAFPYIRSGNDGILDLYSRTPYTARLWPEETMGIQRMYLLTSPYDDTFGEEDSWQFNLVTYSSVNSIVAAVSSRNLEVGEAYQPDITVTVDNLPFVNEPAAYTLKSSKTSVVRATDDGRLEAVAPGTATITATTFDGGKMATFNVTVVKATTLNIPAGTKRIEAEAFMSAAAGSVVILDGCESIGARAFGNCANMKKAEIPNSVTSIADDAFDGCAEGFVIIAPAGSYAAEYAVAHGYTE